MPWSLKALRSHIAREICAFANAAGGRILIGVDDQGRKVGVKDPNRTISEIQTIARNMDPPLVLEIEIVKDVLRCLSSIGTKQTLLC